MSERATPFAIGLTVEQVEAEVRWLAANHDDDEVAHGFEDALHQVVLEAIAINQLSGVDAQRAALVVLETKRMDFSRWYA